MSNNNEKNHKDILSFIEKSCSAVQQQLIFRLIARAKELDYQLYLVGGAVRDALLNVTTNDIDITVRGDAVSLAHIFAKEATITSYHRFGTATIAWRNNTIDLATIRQEAYPKPAALPVVQRSEDIYEDLKRRDFTINAVAFDLTGDKGLIDPHNGRSDIDKKLIRVLHDNSFVDDPTRIFRAARYATRLNFKIEEKTLALLKKNIGTLKELSADRIYHELMVTLKEEKPENTLRMWQQLGALSYVFGEQEIRDYQASFAQARAEHNVSPNIYLALLLWPLNYTQMRFIINKLNATRSTDRFLDQCLKLKQLLPSIAQKETNYAIYQALEDFNDDVLNIALTETSVSAQAKTNIRHFKNKLKRIDLELNGHMLIDMGIDSGKEIADVLQKTLAQKLNFGLASVEDELAFAKNYAQKKNYIS